MIANPEEHFESQYQATSEPWNYSHSGAEKIRYKRVLALARQFLPQPQSVVDVGCGLGLFTAQLADYSPQVYAIDISPTAIEKCKQNIGSAFQDIQFQVTTLGKLDLPPKSVDVIFYCDGIISHGIEGEDLNQTMQQAKTILKDSGIIIFTDFLGYQNFYKMRKIVSDAGLTVLHDEPLHDRLWFQVKSIFKAVQDFSLVKKFLGSESVATFLARISAKKGESGSKHLCMVAKK